MSRNIRDNRKQLSKVEIKIGIFSRCTFDSKNKPTKQGFWCTRNLRGVVWNSGCLDYSAIPKILFRKVKVDYFAKGTRTFQILGKFLDKELENLDDHGCPKFRELVDHKADRK